MQIQYIYWIEADGALQLLAHFTWDGATDTVPTLFGMIEQHRRLAQTWVTLMTGKFAGVRMLERSYAKPIRDITADMQP